MSDPKIVASGRKQVHPGAVPQDSSRAWLVLGWTGLAFLIVGGADFVLLWFPMNFGSPEWEFGTVTQSLNGFPILLLGLGLLTAASGEADRRWWGILGGIASIGLLLWVLGGSVLWSMNVSLALETVPAELAPNIRRAVAKTLLQAMAYSSVLAYLVWRVWTVARAKAVGRGGGV